MLDDRGDGTIHPLSNYQASKEVPMIDLVLVFTTLAVFGVSWLYVRGCDRL